MANTNYTHASIKEIDVAIASKKLSLTKAKEIMTARSQRDSMSGRNAARWLAARSVKKNTPKATPTQDKTTGDPVKKARWSAAHTLCEIRGVEATGPKGGPTPEFWAIYRETGLPEVPAS